MAADLPNRVRCDLTRAKDGSYFFEQRGQQDPLPEDFSGWAAYAVHDGVAHATTAHRTFRRMERTPEGGLLFPPEQLAAGDRCSVMRGGPDRADAGGGSPSPAPPSPRQSLPHPNRT